MMEAALRARLTTDEYQAVILQLEGALAAVDLLVDRAPDFLRFFFAGLTPPTEATLSANAKVALEGLIDELRAQAEPAPCPPCPPRRLLRLVRV